MSSRNSRFFLPRFFLCAVMILACAPCLAAEGMALVESVPVKADTIARHISPPLFYNEETKAISMECASSGPGYFFVREEYSLVLRYDSRPEGAPANASEGAMKQREWDVSQVEKDGSRIGAMLHRDIFHGVTGRKFLWKVDEERDVLHVEKYRIGGKEVNVLSVETRWNDRISGIRKFSGDIATDDGVIYSEWRVEGKANPETVVRLVDFFDDRRDPRLGEREFAE